MKVVSLVNMKGGVLKSTIAVNLAHCLYLRERKRVLLIDVDPQFNATQCLYSGEDYVNSRSRGGHTVLDIFEGTGRTIIDPITGPQHVPAISISDIRPWRYRRNMHIVPGDLELYRLDMVAGQGRELRLKRLLEREDIRSAYDIVLIDTPPTPSVWMTSALLASHAYLVPVRPEPLSRVGIDLLRGVINRHAENHGHSINCLGVVLTAVQRRTLVYNEAIEFLDSNAAWAGKRFVGDMPHRTKVAREQGKQKLILNTNVEDAKLALARITSEFLERLEHV